MNAFKRAYRLDEVASLVRILLGLNLLSLYLFVILPKFSIYFGASGMVNPDLFYYYSGSPLFYFWDNPYFLLCLFLILIILTVLFTLGVYARLIHIPIYLLHLSFHNANPFIIHEPHQLTNLMLVLMLFFPIEGAWCIKKSPMVNFFEKVSKKHVYYMFKIMLVYIGLYYFFAGLKKLPDPLWPQGEALAAIISWPFLGQENILTHLLLKFPSMLKMMNYTALVYELSFVFLIFVTPFRRWLIPLGLIFHLMINMTLDIGHFHLSMWLWYPLLLVDTRSL